MSIELLEAEFKRYEQLENENGYKGNREAAYYYMKRKWETFDIIMEQMRGEK